MTAMTCDECPVKDLQRLKSLLEKRALAKMPEDVREPLLEAKKKVRLAVRVLSGMRWGRENRQGRLPGQARHIKLD
jgi:hypothetical protein